MLDLSKFLSTRKIYHIVSDDSDAKETKGSVRHYWNS